MASADVISVLTIVLLIFASAFFSSSEAAFLSMERSRLTFLVSTNVPGAKRVSDMLDEPGRLLSTILLGNNLVNVGFTALMTVLAVGLLGDGQGVLAATVVGTVVLLIAGEIIPKTIAVHFAEPVAFAYARPIKWIEFVLWPLITVLRFITSRVGSAIGADPAARTYVDEAELRVMIGVGESEGSLEKSEAERLEKVFKFGDRHVSEVMTPRLDMTSIERTATLVEFLEVYALSPHTRLAVYEQQPDNVVGLLSSKDVLQSMAKAETSRDEPIASMVRKVAYVPETKRIAELFDELRRSGDQMAIVVDEYGSVAGMVTLKSLLEELGGRVGEEGVAPKKEFRVIRPNTYIVDAAMSISDANEQLKISLPEGSYETVAGFVLEQLAHVPKDGEVFRHEALSFKVNRMRGVKIETVELTRLREDPLGSSDEGKPL